MTLQDLPSRQKSQRLINRMKSQTNNHNHQFQMYKQRSKNITNIIELLPGLNDISDAFEALPLDLIKYFTLLKEIDAKCINTIPQINRLIERYIDSLHEEAEEAAPAASAEEKEDGVAAEAAVAEKEEKSGEATSSADAEKPANAEFKNLSIIRNKINEIVPCLEEKMQVTRVATDLLAKHMYRINQDYKLIINNNEIPESIRIGPLNHPAMIMDVATTNGNSNAASVDRTVQAVRSESRREALAAKKASKEEEHRRRGGKETTPFEKSPPESLQENVNYDNHVNNNYNNNNIDKKRGRNEEMFSTSTFNGTSKRKRSIKNNEDDDESDSKSKPGATPKSGEREQTYCYCNQVSFGDMVGCDGDDCKREWFHLPCIGFKNAPKGKWYCDDCLMKMKKKKV